MGIIVLKQKIATQAKIIMILMKVTKKPILKEMKMMMVTQVTMEIRTQKMTTILLAMIAKITCNRLLNRNQDLMIPLVAPHLIIIIQ